MIEPLQRLHAQIKDTSEQKPQRLVVITPNAPVYCHSVGAQGDLFMAYGEDNALLYVCPIESARVYAASLVDLRTWEYLQREGGEEAKAQQKLSVEIDPEAHEHVFVKGMGIVPKKVANAVGLQEALEAQRKDAAYVPPSPAYR